MSVSQTLAPIRLLPSDLADQIAAGEVIERPASVVKELIENSLDAGATRVEVELQHGGMTLLRVSDNGQGIAAAELALAISRHATSKIAQLEDLQNLYSLGFRGEALASICSVSEWEVLTHRHSEAQGVRLHHQDPGRPVAVAHTPGTTVSIHNLFFNTPARRKFLRGEPTEYRYCDDVVKRLALSRFEVGFYVQHNQRQVHRMAAVNDDIGRNRRVTQLLGENFIQHALAIEFSYQSLRLYGWLSNPHYSRQQTDQQYFYINGRIIRDRLINHAVRQAYQDRLPPGRQPAYVLYLEMSPRELDVNVHPTKHEVRFHDTRQVHDFLARSLRDSLQRDDRSSSPRLPSTHRSGDTPQVPHTLHVREPMPDSPAHHLTEPGAGLLLWDRYYLQALSPGLQITDLVRVRAQLLHRQFLDREHTPIVARPLLVPQLIDIAPLQVPRLESLTPLLQVLSFDLSLAGPQSMLLRALPARVPVSCGAALCKELLSAPFDISQPDQVIAMIIEKLGQVCRHIDTTQLVSLLQDADRIAVDSLAACRWLILESQLLAWLTGYSPPLTE